MAATLLFGPRALESLGPADTAFFKELKCYLNLSIQIATRWKKKSCEKWPMSNTSKVPSNLFQNMSDGVRS